VWIFVNSFSFIFLEFLAKFYRANLFLMGYKCEIKGLHRKLDRTDPRSRVGRPVRSDRPKGARRQFASVFSLEHAFSTSFFGQKILREV
jgi:hypothetical protein